MNQFARIQGASSQETFWFAGTCNAVAGQIDDILQTMKPLQSAVSKLLNGPPARPASFCLHVFAVSTPF